MMRLAQGEELAASEQHRLYEITEEYIDFIHSLGYKEISKSDSGLFLLYPETLIFVAKIQELNIEYKHQVVDKLTECWIKSLSKFLRYMEQTRAMRQNDTLNALSDYYAVLLMFCSYNDELLGDTLDALALEYRDQFSTRPLTENREQARKEMYKQLKLYASWTSQHYDVESLAPSAFETLVSDVYEPDVDRGLSQQFVPFMSRYGYPSDYMGTKLWTLEASIVYQIHSGLREATESHFNDKENYRKFHDDLIDARDSR